MLPCVDLQIDQSHIWHPYSTVGSSDPVYPVASASGVLLTLEDGRVLIDGMASWWCAIHGYNHPVMNTAINQQLHRMAHIMFGGLTHAPATELTRLLLSIAPPTLETVFYSDSGSVSVEVAMKMALQYWQAKAQPQRVKFVSLRGGYHGDTFGAMSVCDPHTGMHSLFNAVLAQNIFVERPRCRFTSRCEPTDIASLKTALQTRHNEIAAVIMEPVVQGAGGMWFYSPDYLRQARELCHHYDVLLILDEIATGFGRTGKWFACEHADIEPDIMCIGKALTGGYLSLAATLSRRDIADAIASAAPGVFMHGPTFMANPLACTAALTSIKLLLASDWAGNIKRIEQQLHAGLGRAADFNQVNEVRVLGAIGVIEMHKPVNMKRITEAFVEAGVWVRPFGKLVYLMPAFNIADAELTRLISGVVDVVRNYNDQT
jgi:adenosylmethionine-8-amino-7-oxononanoate aminotransferase